MLTLLLLLKLAVLSLLLSEYAIDCVVTSGDDLELNIVVNDDIEDSSDGAGRWMEFTDKALKYIYGKKEQGASWKRFVDFIEISLKVIVDDSSESIKNSVQRSIESLKSKTSSSKSIIKDAHPCNKYTILHYMTKLQLNDTYHIMKAQNQAIMNGNAYFAVYWIPHEHPYPAQYYRDLEVLGNILQDSNAGLIVVDLEQYNKIFSNSSHRNITSKTMLSIENVQDHVVYVFHKLHPFEDHCKGSSRSTERYFWLLSVTVDWIGSLPLTLARWNRVKKYKYMSAGCYIDKSITLPEGDDSVCIHRSLTSDATATINKSRRKGVSSCNNHVVTGVSCHHELSRYSSRLLDEDGSKYPEAIQYVNAATYAYNNYYPSGELTDVGYFDEILSLDWGDASAHQQSKRDDSVLGKFASVYQSFARKFRFVRTSGSNMNIDGNINLDKVDEASDQYNENCSFLWTKAASKECTSKADYDRVVWEFEEGIFAKPGVIFRNRTNE